MFSFLTEPKFPRAALGLEESRVTFLQLQKAGRSGNTVSNAASLDLPAGLIKPSFLHQNISDRQALRSILQETAGLSGLLGQKDWSVSLPTNSARTSILTVEKGSRKELNDLIDWKSEQTFGVPAIQLRISTHRVADDIDGRSRYFATAVKLTVIDEYESIFESLGWRAGLILPRPVCESNWLLRYKAVEDSVLLSSQPDGFSAVMIADGEPSVVRTVTCTESEKDDEIYRLLMFYNDRFAKERGLKQLNRVMAVGSGLNASKIVEIAREASGRTVSILNVDELGLYIPSGSLGFDEIAAPAGLAVLGCR